MFEKHEKKIKSIGIVGSGAMGSGIAQIFAQAGFSVCLLDAQHQALEQARRNHQQSFQKLVEKQKITAEESEHFQSQIHYSTSLETMASADLIIEAIVEDLTAKQNLLISLESLTSKETILATNTSSLSITAIASRCEHPERVIGIHFFNPATIMPLVELIPALQTDAKLLGDIRSLIEDIGKIPVQSRDLPGFIVNRVARPFYGEAIRIWEEGLASMQTIDESMKTFGRFKMGPFELMDFIGHDVNFRVTESVYQAFYQDPRYKPSLTQKRLFEARQYGRKTGMGFYDYTNFGLDQKTITVQPGLQSLDNQNKANGSYEQNPIEIFDRIIAMLINEATDALYLQVAGKEDLDLAVIKGLSYPKGLLRWCDEIGLEKIISILEGLQNTYMEDRYRISPLLRQRLNEKSGPFYQEAL